MIVRFIERGGLWVLAQAVLLAVVFPGGILWAHGWHSSLTIVFGALLLIVGSFCGIAGALRLGRGLTPFPQPLEHTQLVRTGIYSRIRHPLYTAVFCWSIGWALAFASWPALVAALCMIPFFDAKARIEERALRQKFAEYEDYEKRVKRFIPGVY